MQFALDPELAKFIDSQVKAGRYPSADDAINAAVARLQTDTEFSAAEVNDLRTDIDKGLAEADSGSFADFTAEEIIAERRAAMAARRKGA